LETGDDVKHDELVFDLRSSGSSHFSGNVKALHYFIGDGDDDFQSMGHVRAVIDEMSDSGEDMFNILLDSGADASIFPVTLLGKGRPRQKVLLGSCMMRRELRSQLMLSKTWKSG